MSLSTPNGERRGGNGYLLEQFIRPNSNKRTEREVEKLIEAFANYPLIPPQNARFSIEPP